LARNCAWLWLYVKRLAMTLIFVFICILLWVEFRRRPTEADGPRLREWKEPHDPFFVQAANAAGIPCQGNAEWS
jgi:hypothetical protein